MPRNKKKTGICNNDYKTEDCRTRSFCSRVWNFSVSSFKELLICCISDNIPDISFATSYETVFESLATEEVIALFSVCLEGRPLFAFGIIMMLGSKGHVFHACMKKHDFGTRKNMRK